MLTKLIILAISVLGVVLFLWGLVRILRRRVVSGSLQSLFGALLVALAMLSWSIALNLYTYHRLTQELPVATLRFEMRGPQAYQVYVTLPEQQESYRFELRGDEWQVDARVLKWTGLAAMLGLDTGYHLDRISGRYRNVQQARTLPHTVHSLYQERGLDIWQMARDYKSWIPWVDAIYGSATYMPMADRAEYAVTISTTGLLSRPTNDIAREAVQRWQ